MSASNDFWFPSVWPAQQPERIQLYSMATPNGQKIAIALEEMGLAYEAHLVDISQGAQHHAEYQRLSPNGKIPSLSDPSGPVGQLLLMESGAILEYLAAKTGQLHGSNAAAQWQVKQWLYFQVGHVGPMFGQFGHFFKYAKDACNHPYPLSRYAKETQRLLGVIEHQLKQHPYIAGAHYTIADIALWPWVDCLDTVYGAADELQLANYAHVRRWRGDIAKRPAVERGRNVCRPG